MNQGGEPQAQGIHPRWASGWQRRREELERYRDDPELALLELVHYADTGATLTPSRNPEQRSWEGKLRLYLARYAKQRLVQLELSGLEGPGIDAQAAGAAFAAAYTSWLVDAWLLAKLVERGHKSLPPLLNTLDLPFTALGVVVGARREAETMARVQIRACRQGYYLNVAEYPLLRLMLDLLADHLGEPALVAKDVQESEPCAALFQLWREPDAQRLLPACLVVCDLHTVRSVAKASEMREYDNGFWTRIPVEVLLLFKLRTLGGLANPEIHHPLVNDAFAGPFPEVGFKPDDLLGRVRARMIQDGFDEARIMQMHGVQT